MKWNIHFTPMNSNMRQLRTIYIYILGNPNFIPHEPSLELISCSFVMNVTMAYIYFHRTQLYYERYDGKLPQNWAVLWTLWWQTSTELSCIMNVTMANFHRTELYYERYDGKLPQNWAVLWTLWWQTATELSCIINVTMANFHRTELYYERYDGKLPQNWAVLWTLWWQTSTELSCIMNVMMADFHRTDSLFWEEL